MWTAIAIGVWNENDKNLVRDLGKYYQPASIITFYE